MKATAITDKSSYTQQIGRAKRVALYPPTAYEFYDDKIDFAPITPESYNAKKLDRYPSEEPHFVNHFYESYRMYKLTGIDALKCSKLINSLQVTAENLRQFYLSTGRIPSQDEADIISIAGVEKLISIINK